jgi:hypothetical protein
MIPRFVPLAFNKYGKLFNILFQTSYVKSLLGTEVILSVTDPVDIYDPDISTPSV